MPRDRSSLLLVIASTSLLMLLPARTHAGLVTYSVDVLSPDRYPQVQDSYMMRINDRGVAAGYLATASAEGPYRATTYAGGQFRPLGIESVGLGNYFGLVTGINNQGDVAGQVTNADGTITIYVARGGVAQAITLPPGAGAPDGGLTRVIGIGDDGTAYGQYVDKDGNPQVFTATGSIATPLKVALAGFDQFSLDTTSHLLSATGVLGVYASSASTSASPALLYDTRSGGITQLATPAGFTYDDIYRVSMTGVYGAVTDANFAVQSLAAWNLDGTFRGFIPLPSFLSPNAIHFNDLGQAIGLNTTDHRPVFYDGSSWVEGDVAGLGNYTLADIEDFNDRGDFVGLAYNSTGFEYGYVASAVPSAVPEPSSLALLACGGLGVLVAARRSRRHPRD